MFHKVTTTKNMKMYDVSKVFLYILKKSKQRCGEVMLLLVKILHLGGEKKGCECCVKGFLWKE
jgi:hypothetical protein